MTEPLNIEAWSQQTQRICRQTLEKLEAILHQVDTSEIRIDDAKGVYNLANSIAAISKSVHLLEMSSRDRQSVIAELKHEFQMECRRVLSGEPELLEGMLQVLDRVEDHLTLDKR